MSYAVEYEVPGTEEFYGRVKAEIGNGSPDGLIVHVVTKSPWGLRHVEVWNSKESWESFRDERVRPAVASVLAKIGISDPPEPPAERSLEVVDVWMGKS